jgi:hypothetical protein
MSIDILCQTSINAEFLNFFIVNEKTTLTIFHSIAVPRFIKKRTAPRIGLATASADKKWFVFIKKLKSSFFKTKYLFLKTTLLVLALHAVY